MLKSLLSTESRYRRFETAVIIGWHVRRFDKINVKPPFTGSGGNPLGVGKRKPFDKEIAVKVALNMYYKIDN